MKHLCRCLVAGLGLEHSFAGPRGTTLGRSANWTRRAQLPMCLELSNPRDVTHYHDTVTCPKCLVLFDQQLERGLKTYSHKVHQGREQHTVISLFPETTNVLSAPSFFWGLIWPVQGGDLAQEWVLRFLREGDYPGVGSVDAVLQPFLDQRILWAQAVDERWDRGMRGQKAVLRRVQDLYFLLSNEHCLYTNRPTLGPNDEDDQTEFTEEGA